MKRSPLRVPPYRAPVFRFILATLFLALGIWVATLIIPGLWSGVLPAFSRYQHFDIDRTLNPNRFWFVADEVLRRANDSGPIGLLFFIPPLFAAIPIGFFIANVIVYAIQPARRAFDREAVGIGHSSYSEAQKDLALLMLLTSCPTFLLTVAGAFLLRVSW